MRGAFSAVGVASAVVLLAVPVPAQSGFTCTWQASGDELLSRLSPPDSASVRIADGLAKVCYGAPSARGRTMLGGEHVPYGELWRLGANEATRLHLDFPASVGGVVVGPGTYSLYAIPGPEEWRIFVNRETEHWGNQLTPEVRAREVGSLIVPAETLQEHVERMRLRFEATGDATANLVAEWERTRVRIPIRNSGA